MPASDLAISIGISTEEARAGHDQIIAFNAEMAASYAKLIESAKGFGAAGSQTAGAGMKDLADAVNRTLDATVRMGQGSEGGAKKLRAMADAAKEAADGADRAAKAQERLAVAAEKTYAGNRMADMLRDQAAYTAQLNALARDPRAVLGIAPADWEGTAKQSAQAFQDAFSANAEIARQADARLAEQWIEMLRQEEAAARATAEAEAKLAAERQKASEWVPPIIETNTETTWLTGGPETYAAEEAALKGVKTELASVFMAEEQLKSGNAETLQSTERYSSALAQLDAQLGLISSQDLYYAQMQAKLNDLHVKGAITTDQLQTRMAVLHDRMDKSAVSARAQAAAMTNLSYQINDVVTGLATGQPVWMIVAQQGGQFVQVFQEMGMSLGRIALYAAPIAAVGAAIYTVIKADTEIRALTVSLEAFNNTALGTVSQLRDTSFKLSETGPFSRTEVESAILALTKYRDVSADSVGSVIQLAKDYAAVTGSDLTSATNTVAKAVSGNYDEFAKMADMFGRITPLQKEHIQDLIQQGDKAGAARLMIDGLNQSLSGMAEKGMSDSSKAFHQLGTAWDNFTESVSKTDFVKNATKNWAAWLDVISGAISTSEDDLKKEISAIQKLQDDAPDEFEKNYLADVIFDRQYDLANLVRKNKAASSPAASAGTGSGSAADADRLNEINNLINKYDTYRKTLSELVNDETNLNKAVKDGTVSYTAAATAIEVLRAKRAALTDGSKEAINVEAELAKKTVSEVTGIVAAKYAEMLVDAKADAKAMADADAWYYDAMKKVSAAATTAVNDNSKSIGNTAKSTGDTIASSMTAGYNAAWDASKKSVDGQISNLTLLENKAKDAAAALAAANAENPYGTTGFTSLEQFSAKNALDDANKALEFAKESAAGDAAIKQTQSELDAWNKRLYGSANGNVFDSGNIVPFASGGAFDSGVVTTPTYFPMAGGKTGLMGEAGPEAVIPLERDSSGRLGLAGGETHIHVGGITINAPAGSDPKAIAQAVVAEINKMGAAGKPVLHTNTLKSRTAMNG